MSSLREKLLAAVAFEHCDYAGTNEVCREIMMRIDPKTYSGDPAAAYQAGFLRGNRYRFEIERDRLAPLLTALIDCACAQQSAIKAMNKALAATYDDKEISAHLSVALDANMTTAAALERAVGV